MRKTSKPSPVSVATDGFTCASCETGEGKDGYCKTFHKVVDPQDGGDCSAHFKRRPALLRAENLLRNWKCFAAAQNLNCSESHVLPIVVDDADQSGEDGFERFCRLSGGNFHATPLFLMLPGARVPDQFPHELIHPLFDLNQTAERAAGILAKKAQLEGAGVTAHHFGAQWLLDHVFPLSFGRHWLALSKLITGKVFGIEERVGWALGLGVDDADEGVLRAEWEKLVSPTNESADDQGPEIALRSLAALLELDGKPGLLVLDDLAGRAGGTASTPHSNWKNALNRFKEIFNVSAPMLPVLSQHGKQPDELLPIIRSEIDRLPRPLAAVVDMNWIYGDNGERDPLFGLELIRLIRKAKPSLPVFVWSPIKNKQTQQKAMQLGAANFFDKPAELSFGHGQQEDEEEKTDRHPKPKNLLTPAKLWFHILEWERTRYRMPPVEGCGRSFLLNETRDTKKEREKFLRTFNLNEGKLLAEDEPEVERLLRALVPEAAQVEILRFFGEGRSGSEPPFIVRGKTRSGRWLRPVQIKISKDWRALAREGKGYRDVFAGALGPSVAHVEAGPFRLKEWSAMSQSFAAPEEAIREIGTKSTRSLSDWLRKNLWKPDTCRQLVNELFDGVLDPFYRDNLEKRKESVVRAFDRVSPAHLETIFTEVQDHSTEKGIDLTPQKLSTKDEKARRETAHRSWREVEAWFADTTKGSSFPIQGMVIDTLEIDSENPLDSRLRVLDPTLGVKIDLKAGIHDIARRWKALAESPIKLRGLPVSFQLEREKLKKLEKPLLGGWGRSVLKKLKDAGLYVKAAESVTAGKEAHGENKAEQPSKHEKLCSYFFPIHPLDWTEEFHVGPTHGDLNLGNILLHQKGNSYFPWLIDFDKAEENRPVVFDLAKLEIEAYHKIGQELYWELRQLGCARGPKEWDRRLRDLLLAFEHCLEKDGIESIDHLWERFARGFSVPESLRLRFAGFFAYLRQVHERIEKLGITRREFLIGRAIYCFCCIKFKHLYEAKSHPNAPFPAQVLLWKFEALIEALDAENGIPSESEEELPEQKKWIQGVVWTLRNQQSSDKKTLLEVLASKIPDTSIAPAKGWDEFLRLLRNKSLPGEGRWFRELLWYARDHGVAATADTLALFTVAVAKASAEPGEELKPDAKRKDFASTGRPGNVYPTLEMFRALAEDEKIDLVKMSTRGESGGTIDILEQAGVPLCASRAAIDEELRNRGWAVATTSKDICEVDKILWNLRKETNCMKVADLVIASISAKKLAVGIGNFDVQVATGYDAKLVADKDYLDARKTDGGKSPTSLSEWWSAVWTQSQGQAVSVADPHNGFNTDSLMTWFNGTDEMSLAVLGTALLAAQIWREHSEWHPQLKLRMPNLFCEKMARYSKLLESVEFEALNVPHGRRTVFHLKDVDYPPHLAKVSCWTVDDLHQECDGMRDIRAIFFRFEHDIRDRVVVPFFDTLYSDHSKKHGNELTSIIFAPRWIAMLIPKAGCQENDLSGCWNVLARGFEEKAMPKPREPLTVGVEVEHAFSGDQKLCGKIVRYLEKKAGFWGESQQPIQRLHLYFGTNAANPVANRRLRLVASPGEWFRYDFKAPSRELGVRSTEVSFKLPIPVTVAKAVDELIQHIRAPEDHAFLEEMARFGCIQIALSGTHTKTRLFTLEHELEVSFDDLVLLENGERIQEVEIELKAGSADTFGKLIHTMKSDLKLVEVVKSKFQRASELSSKLHPGEMHQAEKAL